MNFLKNNYKLLLSVLALILIAFLTFNYFKQQKVINSYVEPNKIDTTSIVKKWRDKFEREHVLAQVQKINYANLLEAKDEELIKLRDEVNKDKTIMGKSVITIKTLQSIKPLVKDSIIYIGRTDTVRVEDKVKLITYNDDWLNIDAKLFPDNTMDMEYGVKNKLNIYQRTDKPKMFGKPKTMIEIVNENPNTITDKVIIYQIQPAPTGFLQSRTFNILVGIVGGVIIQSQLQK